MALPPDLQKIVDNIIKEGIDPDEIKKGQSLINEKNIIPRFNHLSIRPPRFLTPGLNPRPMIQRVFSNPPIKQPGIRPIFKKQHSEPDKFPKNFVKKTWQDIVKLKNDEGKGLIGKVLKISSSSSFQIKIMDASVDVTIHGIEITNDIAAKAWLISNLMQKDVLLTSMTDITESGLSAQVQLRDGKNSFLVEKMIDEGFSKPKRKNSFKK